MKNKILMIVFMLLLVSTISSFDWTNSLVDYWDFDNNFTSTHLKIDNNSAGGNAVIDSDGIIGGSLNCSNTGYVTYPDNPAWDYTSDSKWTHNFWIKKSTTGLASMITRSPTTNQILTYFNIGSFYTYVYPQGTEILNVGGMEGNLTDNNWHMITITQNTTNSTYLYIDGILNVSSIHANGTPVDSNQEYSFCARYSGNYIGQIDEIGMFNKSLNASEVDELWNSGSGLAYNTSGGVASLTVSLNNPSNNASISANSTAFNSTIDVVNLNITNATLYIWNSTNGIFNTTANFLTGATSNSTTWNITGFDLGRNYKWNVFGCGENSTSTICSWASSNYTFTSSAFSENTASYNFSVFETSRQNFALVIDANPLISSATANIWYNGTKYISDITNGISGIYTSINNLDIPLATSSENKTFKWEWAFTLTDGTTIYQNSTDYSHEVNRTYLTLCNATWTTEFINFTTRNAENPFPILNSTFKSSWDWYLGGGSITRNYSFEDVTETNSTFSFCMSPNQTFHADSHIEIDATGYAQNSHYLVNATLTNLSTAINLYLLNDSKATLTVLKVRDSTQSPLQDILIQIQLYDVGTDSFYTIAMAKTSFNGEDLAYLNWYDSLYKMILIQNGTVIKTTTPYKISETPQIFDIADVVAYSFDKFRDFAYSLIFNNDTKNFVLTFTRPSGLVDQGCLRVVKRTSKNDTEICLVCETSTSATLYCNIDGYGNGTYIAAFYATGSWYLLDWITTSVGGTFAESIYDLLGVEDATAYAFLFSGIVVAMFAINPVLGILGIMLGLIGSAALGFTLIDYTLFMGIAIVGGLIIWIISR